MPLTGKEILKLFLSKGWVILRQKGSHIIIGKGKKREVVPIHGNESLKIGLEKKLLKVLRED